MTSGHDARTRISTYLLALFALGPPSYILNIVSVSGRHGADSVLGDLAILSLMWMPAVAAPAAMLMTQRNFVGLGAFADISSGVSTQARATIDPAGPELRAQIRTAAEEEASRLQADWQTGLQKTNEKLDKLQADLKKAVQLAQSEAGEAV